MGLAAAISSWPPQLPVRPAGRASTPSPIIVGVLPKLDVAAVRAYCEQRVPAHALHQVRVEAVLTRGAVTIVERPVMSVQVV
jgi:hypothetical protein